MMSFSKMHALGNDFAVFYGNEIELIPISQDIKKLSHRFTGIGFDQLLFVIKQEETLFDFHIFNADGSKASQCLNGARCIARFLIEKEYVKCREFSLSNASGVMGVNAHDFGAITLKIPNQASISQEKITIDTLPYHFTKGSIGNDHLVTQVKQLVGLNIAMLGEACQSHFPGGINVGFVELISDRELQLKTYERGAGETYCCASNTLATLAVGVHQGWLKPSVTVNFLWGSLRVSFSDDKRYFYLTGSASHCYDGTIQLSDFSDES